VIKIYLFA